jgi:hypothetical protein
MEYIKVGKERNMKAEAVETSREVHPVKNRDTICEPGCAFGMTLGKER